MRVKLTQTLECEINDEWYDLFVDPETQSEQYLTQFDMYPAEVHFQVEILKDAGTQNKEG